MELTLDQALQKGIEAHKAGNAQEADRYYTAILKAQPKHPDANHNMGVLAVGVGKVNEALPFLKTALEANPNIGQFWVSYIDALIKLERIDDAKAVFDQAKSKGAKGEAFDQIEKRLTGVSTTNAVKNSNVQDPPQEKLQPQSTYTIKKLEKVFKEAQKLSKKYTKSPVLLEFNGASAAQIGKPNEAVLAFKKAISINPNNAEAYNNLGVALKEQGKLDKAIEAYKKALSIKPKYAEAHNNLGNVFRDKGKLTQAIEAYTKALSIKSDYADAHNNMGKALYEQGKLKKQ